LELKDELNKKVKGCSTGRIDLYQEGRRMILFQRFIDAKIPSKPLIMHVVTMILIISVQYWLYYRNMRFSLIPILLAICFTLNINTSSGYSVLSHEAIVDACWDKYIQPLLHLKYPEATDKQLENARAYAYGGAVMPDMGYYPFEATTLSNYIHYVRTGDFVENLIKEAQNVDEYAFALGVLSHYYADIYGHGLGVNHSEPLIYPKIKDKFGNVVTYEQATVFHTKTEFGFDVLQTARGNYVSKDYHRFIGFKISRPVLERAFEKTYGLNMNKTFPNLGMSITTFRWSIMHLVPWFTRVAWAHKKADIQKAAPGAKARSFKYKMQRLKAYSDGEDVEQNPSLSSYIFSFIVRVMPKLGKMRAINFKTPPPEAEKIFLVSFDTTVSKYSAALMALVNDKTDPPNKNYDTGKEIVKGDYHLTDNSYDNLLLKLDKSKYEMLRPDEKKDILTFYGSSYDKADRKLSSKQRKIKEALNHLKNTQPATNSKVE
jgi:hypothetical protein